MALFPGLVFPEQMFSCSGNDLALQRRNLELAIGKLLWSSLPFLKLYFSLWLVFRGAALQPLVRQPVRTARVDASWVQHPALVLVGLHAAGDCPAL